MPSRSIVLRLPQFPREAYHELSRVAQKQDWLITKPIPYSELRVTPELRLRSGHTQPKGCGRTCVKFHQNGFNGTFVSLTTRWAWSDKLAATPARSLLEGLGFNPKDYHLNPDAIPVPGRAERGAVRLLVASIIVIARLAFALVPVHDDKKGNPELPPVALGQEGIFRLEVALLAFYGGLLLLTPAFSGIIRGRLPTEISARGAKFSEDVSQVAEITEKRIKKLEDGGNALAEELALVAEGIKPPKAGEMPDTKR